MFLARLIFRSSRWRRYVPPKPWRYIPEDNIWRSDLVTKATNGLRAVHITASPSLSIPEVVHKEVSYVHSNTNWRRPMLSITFWHELRSADENKAVERANIGCFLGQQRLMGVCMKVKLSCVVILFGELHHLHHILLYLSLFMAPLGLNLALTPIVC
jgi:hypothetical protein